MVILGAAKLGYGLTKKIIKVARPREVDLESQIKEIMLRDDIRQAYLKHKGDSENFYNTLKKYIDSENYKVGRLRSFGSYLDNFNKATLPVSVALDASIIGYGVGTTARALKTLATAPGYLAYDAYYLGKTHDLVGTLGNILYEGVSWFVPGELPHLISRYTKQADSYAAHKGADFFLESLKGRGNVIDLAEERRKRSKSRKKSKDLEGLALAA